MLFVVFLPASPTPAEEIEPERGGIQEHIIQLKVVEREILCKVGRPQSPPHLSSQNESKQAEPSQVGYWSISLSGEME